MRWAEPAALVDDEARAFELLSATERSRYATTLSVSARERLLWGRLLLRELVAEQIGIQPAEVTIDARCTDCGGPHGRPVATGPGDDARALSLSVSACAGMVVVVTSRGRPVGIDVEPRASSAGRLQAIRQVAGDTGHPLRHWTRIEAVLKADGRGLRVDPRQVRVHTQGAELEGTLYRFAEPDFDPRFVLSAAFGPECVAAAEARQG
jgi:4'-phosphopantetheinyl transferase